jgi:hypothetical protein
MHTQSVNENQLDEALLGDVQSKMNIYKLLEQECKINVQK